VPPPATWDEDSVAGWLLALASAIRDSTPIRPDDDLFAQGFDRHGAPPRLVYRTD
jgi:hypothetical protein